MSTQKKTILNKNDSDNLKLKMGLIKQYSMIVENKKIAHFENLGWLEYQKIGLSIHNRTTSLLYGEFNREKETLLFNRPILLKDVQKKEIIGRSITKVNTSLGSYGTGSPNFFGLLLDDNEYLVYAVWHAGNYVFVDDGIVRCSSNLYYKVKPWISNSSGEIWDHLTDYISGSVIVDYTLEKNTFKLILQKDKQIEVQFVQNSPKIPKNTSKFRNAYQEGTISDYIIFQHKDASLIV